MAGLLKLEIQGRYILIELPRRPGCYGPIGGVYKYFPAAARALEELDFVRDEEGFEGDIDHQGDLRGIVPSSNILRFIRWFKDSPDREHDVVTRELREELLTAGIIDVGSPLLTLQTRHLRSIHEGPYQVKGRDYLQYRWFDIFEPADLSNSQLEELANLVKSSGGTIRTVTRREIEANTTVDHRIIGDHTEYLLSKRPMPGQNGSTPFCLLQPAR